MLDFPSSLGKPVRSFSLEGMPCVGFEDSRGRAGAAVFRSVGSSKPRWDPVGIDWVLEEARAISMAELEASVDRVLSRFAARTAST
jgi:hypothetical protein